MLIDNNIKSKIEKHVNGFDILYWINLDRSNERRTNMLQMLSYFPVPNIRITAVDGKNSSDEVIHNMITTTNYNGSKIEFACLLSHLNTIKIFTESSYNIALIMEDDMNLEFVKYWIKDINTIIMEAPPDWDIIQLSYIRYSHLKLTSYYTRNNNSIWGTGAYLININGAKKLMNYINQDDKFNLHGVTPIADTFLYTMLISYIYKYPYFTYADDNESTIHEDHLALHLNSKLSIIKELKQYYKSSDEFVNSEYSNKNDIMVVVFYIIIFIVK